MKILPVILAISTMLVSCRQTEQRPASLESTQVKPPQVMADTAPTHPLPETPQKTCGDPLPRATMPASVNFYPVIVDYSEKNLDLVKKHFCEDALKRFSQMAKKDIIQVGSFANQEKANEFKIKLAQYFTGVEVGEPTIVKALSTESRFDMTTMSNVVSAATLTSEQADRLKNIVGISQDFENQNVVILPTYVPKGFKVVGFTSSRSKMKTKTLALKGGHYSITYKNEENQCFYIEGGAHQPIGDKPPRFEKLSHLPSPALGDVEIGITSSEKFSSKGLIGFTGSMYRISRGRNSYTFVSPPISYGKDENSECRCIEEKDAARIVRSLQFLSP
jgi:hypothetical protein